MQGVFMHGSRPQTKKVLKEVIEAINTEPDPNGREDNKFHRHDGFCITLEATSVFGDEYDGSLAFALREDPPQHGPFNVVGPDPRTARKWYATITYDTASNKWKVQ